MTTTLRLIYIIGTYPLLTTTFIDREIRILRRLGVDLQIVSIRRPPVDVPLSKEQRELQQGVDYLLPVHLGQLLLAHVYFIFTHPWAFFGTLAYLLTRAHPTFKDRLKTLLHFGEGVELAYRLRQRDFHELHAHFVDRAVTLALVAGRLLHKPYSLSIHAGADIYVHPVLLHEKISEARQAATCTTYNKTYLETLLGAQVCEKITCIPHGLEMTNYQPADSNGDGRHLILAVGQLAGRKGFAQLIQGCSELKARGYRFKCQIIGSGPQQKELETLIAHLALEDTVSLCGALPHEAVVEHYKHATIFALPCIQSQNGDMDGIPNVLLEAMSMQLPVVSTHISAIPELVQDQVNGLLVAPNDHRQLVEALARLLDEPALRQQLGNAGRQAVLESYNVENNVRRFARTLWPDWFEKTSLRGDEILWLH